MNEQMDVAPMFTVEVSDYGTPVVKTCTGYEIPYLIAIKFWQHMLKKRATKDYDKRQYHSNGNPTGKVFKYTAPGGINYERRVRIDRLGMHIGCQTFQFADCRAFAKLQGWALK